MLGPYTTNSEVRSVYGLAEEELSDDMLDLPLHEANLRLELRQVGATLAKDFTDTKALPDPLTDPQKDFVDAVTLFAPYAVALQLEQSLPLLAAKSVTDGKAGVTRNSEAPFADQIKACKKNYERFRQNLEKAYAAFKNGSAPVATQVPLLFTISSPDSDPVLGT